VIEGNAPKRLRAELKILGGLCALWAFYLAYGVLWIVATRPADLVSSPLPWLLVAGPQVLGIQVVGIGLFLDLPRARWVRRHGRARPRPWLWLGLAAPLLPIAALLTIRDRQARAAAPSAAEVEAAFHRLLRLPRALGLRMFTWCGLATLTDAALLAAHYRWTRTELVVAVLLGLAILAPLCTMAVGWARTALRPEVLSAPREQEAFVRRRGFRLRLIVNAAIASAGIIATPLCAAFLWRENQPRENPVHQAEALAERASTLATHAADEEIGSFLVRHRGLALRIGTRWFGPAYPSLEGRGPIDVDGDGQPDVVAFGPPQSLAVAPIAPPPAPFRRILLIGGFCALAMAVASSVLVVLDMHQDLDHAIRLAAAVADGRPAPHTGPRRFGTYELHSLVGSVERLVGRITEANIAKYVAIERAKEADRLKSQFLANMSHDLRSPLNSIMGFSELLLSGIDGELEPDQREMVATIHENGRALLQQIDDILDTAKIEASRLDLHPEPIPPLTLINRAIHSAKKRQRGQVEYTLDADAGLPPVVVDPFRIVQALENILLFASERMDTGTLRIELHPIRGPRGRMVQLSTFTPVRPASSTQLARALRGFHRLPGHRGLGLGLPLSASILELHGGALHIEDLDEGMVLRADLGAPDLAWGRETKRR